MAFAATQMQLDLMLSEVSQQERQIPYDITYMWNLKYGTNEPTCRTEIDAQTLRLEVASGRGRERDGWEVWGS